MSSLVHGHSHSWDSDGGGISSGIKKSKPVKLDLFNSRVTALPDRGPRVFDSLEGEYIRKPMLPVKQVFKASFKSKQPKTDFMRKTEKVPDRFNLAVVDNSGNFVEMKQTVLRAQMSARTSPQMEKEPPTLPLANLLSLPEYNSSFLDAIRDGVYKVKDDSVKQRLEGGKLPGALWPVEGRKFVPHWNKLGPGDYEVYGAELTPYGPAMLKGGSFCSQSSVREHEEDNDPQFLPWKERKRHHIREQWQLSKSQSASMFHSNCAKDHSDDSNDNGNCVVRFNGPDRFDNSFYRQEKFIKTTGLLLGPDFDRNYGKKIPFSFETHEATKDARAKGGKKKTAAAAAAKLAGADVDVDVGHLFSLQHQAMTSPIKYSAAFRSSAKVGMEIPVPTSGANGGPGAFPGAAVAAVVVREPHMQSRPFKQERTFELRKAGPPLTAPYPKFSELHRSGPLLTTAKTDGKNEWMEKVVRDKMTRIYPRLARQKFPPKPKPSPQRTGKLK